jgi:DsbC/DsbD-like thiol-disulfide interchange protein
MHTMLSHGNARTAALLLGALAAGGSHSANEGNLPDARGLVQAELVVETSTLQRGKSAWLAVHLKMRPGWHTYWRNPGDSGLATTIRWTLPPGVSAGPIVWPQPDKFGSRTIAGYGYADDVALLSTLSVATDFAPASVTIGALVSWLACEKVCIPGSQQLTIALPVTDAIPVADRAAKMLFARTRQRIPQRAPFAATFELDEQHLRLRVPGSALSRTVKSEMMFYPFDNTIIDHGASQALLSGPEHVDLVLRRSVIASNEMATLTGVLVVRAAGSNRTRAFEVSATRAEGNGALPKAH